MKEVFDTIFIMEEGYTRDSLNEVLHSAFSEILKKPDALYYSWKSLDKIGNLVSEDGKIRVFTWYLPENDGKQYQYYGYIQLNQGKNKRAKEDLKVYPLKDLSDEIDDPGMASLNPDRWFGCVYYKIKSFQHRRGKYYVLFGYDFNDLYSQKKIIEVLRIDKKGELIFEGKFDSEFEGQKRIIFEYSDRVAMSVNYDERTGMIIWDHLSPFQPIFSGSYRFYGPDGSYDGLLFHKSVFQFQKDVDARNQ